MKRGCPWVFRCASTLACVATVLPLFKGSQWWLRVFDFPRVQVAMLATFAASLGFACRSRLGKGDHVMLHAAEAAAAAQLLHVLKYTPAFPKQVIRSRAERIGNALSILTANVRTRNRNVEPLLKAIKERGPDLVLLVEPDRWWLDQLKPLHDDYPFRVLRPLDNTYGMLLFSRLELIEPEVRFLVQEDVPSIRTRVRLPNGEQVWFYGVHPRPPVRGNTRGDLEFEGAKPRDAELIVVATEVGQLKQPVVVAGDFNDVAWSHTTRRFQRLGRLLDPRVGRGLYNTFHAHNRLFRFPLDHLFMSEHFSLVEFRRESSIGSDHFPISAELQLDSGAEQLQEPPAPAAGDLEEARETVAEAKEVEATRS